MRMNGKNIPWEPLVSIHLRLVGLPLFLFLIALTADISYSISANPLLHAAGFIVVSTGIPVALLNALIGLVRGEALGFATRAGRIAWVYGALNLVVMLLFTISWLLRRTAPGMPDLVQAISYAGILLGFVALWLGGEIVYGLEVGGGEAWLERVHALPALWTSYSRSPRPGTGR